MSDGAGAISPPYTDIGDTPLSAGKPWTQTLARTMRDDIDHVHKLVHDTANGHNHDGVNSALISAAASIILPDAPLLKASGTTSASWASVSIASDTGSATAKIAVVCIRLLTTGTGASQVDVRRTGSSPGTLRSVVLPVGGLSGQLRHSERTILVPLNGSEQFDYQVTLPGGGSWSVHVEGWIV